MIALDLINLRTGAIVIVTVIDSLNLSLELQTRRYTTSVIRLVIVLGIILRKSRIKPETNSPPNIVSTLSMTLATAIMKLSIRVITMTTIVLCS